MEGKLRILVITPHYIAFTKGLMEATARSVSRVEALVYHNRWTEISHFLPSVGDKLPRAKRNTKKELIDWERVPENVGVHIANGFFGTFERTDISYGDKMFACMMRKIKSTGLQFDIVHGHFVWPWGYVASKISREFNVPLVVTAHGHDAYEVPFINDEWRKRTESVLNSASCVITVSKNNLACLRRLSLQTEVKVIPNGFDDALFHPMDRTECRKQLGLSLDKRIILTVGRLSPEKGHQHIIEAVEEIVARRKDLLCVVIGTGGMKSSIKRMIREKNLEEHFMLLSDRPHKEIPVWMNASEFFVMASLMEGNPTVLFETLGCGIPFVGTNVGGIPDIVTSDEYGLLCPPKDTHALAGAILSALDREWKRDAILDYARNFTWGRIASQVVPIYESCLSRARVKMP
jgi:teichuronic acid biosynthesis glycosyltransferase TuaC